MYDDFKPEKLQEFLPYFIEGIEDILFSWCSRAATSALMQKRELNENDMINVIGIRILSYTFDIIEQTESLQYCPYAQQLVKFFDKHKIKINELFLIYMDLSAVVREYLFVHVDATQKEMQKILEDFSLIFEYNLSDVLHIYFELQLDKIEKEQENVLKERKLLEDYKKIVDTINGVVVTKTNGTISFVNDKFCEYSGYNKELLLGRTLYPIKHPDNDTDFYKNMWQDIKEKQLFRGIIKNRRKDRSDYYVDSTIAPIINTKNQITHYISLQRDITKEVEQEKVLKETQEKEENIRLNHVEHKKVDELITILPIAAFILNAENIVVNYNEYFASLFDPFEQSELLSKLSSFKLRIEDFITPTSQEYLKSYAPMWTNLYSELYEENTPLQITCQSDYNYNNYLLKISVISKANEPLKALVCLETLK